MKKYWSQLQTVLDIVVTLAEPTHTPPSHHSSIAKQIF